MKKNILYIFLISALIFAGYLYYQKSFKSTPAVLNEMSGRITEVRQHSIIVQSGADPLDANNSGEVKKIEFVITDKTVFNRHRIIITLEQVNSGKEFHPETVVEGGNIADLKPGTKIVKITTEDDPLDNSQVTAKEIVYVYYDTPAVLQ